MSLNRLLYVLIGLALVIVAGLTIRTAVATSAVAATAHDSYDELERIRAGRDSVKTADFSYDEVERNRSQFLITGSVDRSNSAPDLSDYALRHPNAVVPVSAPDLSDYALRHPNAVIRLGAESEVADGWLWRVHERREVTAPDLSDYALRHRDEIQSSVQPDLTDYALRHIKQEWTRQGAAAIDRLFPGKEKDDSVAQPLPFGPGWAAVYGTADVDPAEDPESLPFGPGLAANHGTPSESVFNPTFPFGPGWAATYGVPAR